MLSMYREPNCPYEMAYSTLISARSLIVRSRILALKNFKREDRVSRISSVK
jgi:hypothetical protein